MERDLDLDAGVLRIQHDFPHTELNPTVIMDEFFDGQIIGPAAECFDKVSPFYNPAWFGKNLKTTAYLLGYLHSQLSIEQKAILIPLTDAQEITFDLLIRKQITSMIFVAALTGDDEALAVLRSVIMASDIDESTKSARITHIEGLIIFFSSVEVFQVHYLSKSYWQITTILLDKHDYLFNILKENYMHKYVDEGLAEFMAYHAIYSTDIFNATLDIILDHLPVIEHKERAVA